MESNARTTSSTAAPHIPTARPAAGSYTRASLDAAIRDAASDEPRPYDRELLGLEYGRPFAHGCF